MRFFSSIGIFLYLEIYIDAEYHHCQARKAWYWWNDDKDILNVLKKGLELNNFEVYAFESPNKALEYLNSVHSPQLLITDLRMPEMSGFELARKVNKDHPEMGIMALTGFEIERSEFEKVFPSTKIDALIDKPVRISKLVDAANAIIKSKRKSNQF